MSALQHLRDRLDAAGVPYEVLHHPTAYTAEDTAAAQHLPGDLLAKVVVCMAGEAPSRPLLAAVPAPWRVHVPALARLAGERVLRLATEHELRTLFPDCEVGAMPPFGSVVGMPLWVDDQLAAHRDLVFNAGTHRHVVRMHWADFARLEHPRCGDFAVRHDHP